LGPELALRISRTAGLQLIEPSDTFGRRPRDPVPTHRGDEIDSAAGIPTGHAVPKDGADVVDLQVHPFEPVRKPVTSVCHGPLASRPVVVGASLAEDGLLTRLAEPERRIFAHRLVQPMARDTLDVLF